MVTGLHVLDELLYVPEFGRHFWVIFLKISGFFLALGLWLVVRALLLGFLADKTDSRSVRFAGEQGHLFRSLRLGRLCDFRLWSKETDLISLSPNFLFNFERTILFYVFKKIAIFKKLLISINYYTKYN